ncbi:MAG: DMT family transporter [Natronospirillum sp.]
MTLQRIQALPTHTQGILIATVGVLVLSFDALLVRLAGTDPWTASFWRGLLIGLTMTGVVLVRGEHHWRPATRRLFVLMLVLMLTYGMNTSLFVFSVTYTHAANTVVILASAPFFAALFSRWWLREHLARRTAIAIAVCLAGVALVFGGSMGSVNWQGDGLALILAMSTGGLLTVLRTVPTIPRTLLVAGAGYVTALATMVAAEPLSIGWQSWGWLVLMGMLQMPIASVLLMMAPKYLPSPEVSLFLLIETVLGPVWVWWVIHETPEATTLWGGALILLTVAVHAGITLRQDLRRRKPPTPIPVVPHGGAPLDTREP